MKRIILFLVFINLGLLGANFWKPFDNILKEVVFLYNYSSIDGDFYHTAVDYQKIKINEKLMNLMKKQWRALGDYSLSGDYLEQDLSFWINAYNFFTIVDIVVNFPVKSMKDEIGWDNQRHSIGGKKFSLNTIEHKIIRKYNDARIHFAINCASVGCPALINEVFAIEKLNQQLDEVTKNSLRNPLHLYKHPSKKLYWHTKLFDWFVADFEKKPYSSIREFIEIFAPSKYRGISSTHSIPYDWNINTPKNIKGKMSHIQKKYPELKITKKEK